MRRTVLYTAGLMFAAGASLALAGPASAAPAAATTCCSFSGFAAPNHPSYSSNQWLNQTSTTNQQVLNNVGNSQYGLLNINGGGTASATSTTNQVGRILGW